MTPIEQLDDHEKRISTIEAWIKSQNVDPFLAKSGATPLGQAPPSQTVYPVDNRLRLAKNSFTGQWIVPDGSQVWGGRRVQLTDGRWFDPVTDVDSAGYVSTHAFGALA